MDYSHNPDRELRVDQIRWTLAPAVTPSPLSLSDAELVLILQSERVSYQLLAQQAIHALASVTRAYDHLQQRYQRVLSERRTS